MRVPVLAFVVSLALAASAAAAEPRRRDARHGIRRLRGHRDGVRPYGEAHPRAWIDLRLEVAACRRLAVLSCSDDGVRPPNWSSEQELGGELGSVVVVAVGYNDYENIDARTSRDSARDLPQSGSSTSCG